MNYICFPCNEIAYDTFYKKEKVFYHLLKKSDDQIEVFLKSFIGYEMIEKILRYFKNEYLEIYENTLYYKNNTLTIHKYYIETNDIQSNILFDYMKRYHKIWCCMDDRNKVIWINTCKVL